MTMDRLYFHLEDHNRALHPPRNGRQHCHVRLATEFLPNSGFFVKRNGREDLHIRFEETIRMSIDYYILSVVCL